MKHILRFSLYITLLASWALGFSPTPNPHPIIELTCDNAYIPTKAYPIRKESKEHEIVFLSPDAHTNDNIGIDPYSLKLINEDSMEVTSILIENVGQWLVGDTGGLIFIPADDFNGTSTVQYTIGNNCDASLGNGRSTPTAATVRMEGINKSLPVHNSVCLFAKEGKAHNDKIIMHQGEKMKVIDIFKNDYSGIDEDFRNGFINSSLRLSPTIDQISKRVYQKGKGTWLADTNAGQIYFIPDSHFSGEAHMTYAVDSACSKQTHLLPTTGRASYGFSADITIIAPTPTPTPCPQAKKPVCGQENLCTVSASGETVCLASIPRNTSYANMCELFRAGDVFLYEGECKKPTPTPTPKVVYVYITPTPTPMATPTTTPKPTVVTPKEETKPKPPTTTPTDTNTSTSTSKVKSTNGSAFGVWSILMMMLLTVMLVIMDKKRENA